MRNIKSTKHLVIKACAIATLLAGNFGGTALAWGPERTTYTNESPAPYATFNSITNNVAVGDERNFVRVGEVGSTEPYRDEIEVVPGKEYEVYVYYHNDAASNTNKDGYGMATNTRVSSGYPTTLKPGDRGMVSGIISWSYVTPEKPNDAQTGKVWDEAYLTTKSDNVILRFKAASAVIHNDGAANGSILPTALFSEEGTPIGFNKLAGTIPGCAEYSGYITYTIVAEQTKEDCTTNPDLPECKNPDCETNPDLPECKQPDCTTNPDLPECKQPDCTTNPDAPECQEKNCKTNPEMEGCQELPNTGPLEIIMAIIIIAGIGGGGYYLYRTKKTLKTAESTVKGKDSTKADSTIKADSATKSEPAKKEAKTTKEKQLTRSRKDPSNLGSFQILKNMLQ